MNNYIVYEKEECDCVYARNSGDYSGSDICPMCYNKGYILFEVSLEDAIKNLLRGNTMDSTLTSEIKNAIRY